MYLLFCFNTYYPCGGMNDFEGDFESIDKARAEAKSLGYDCYQVVRAKDWVIEEEEDIGS